MDKSKEKRLLELMLTYEDMLSVHNYPESMKIEMLRQMRNIIKSMLQDYGESK